MATCGIEKIPDSLGYLVLKEDGAVISSGGDLENDEKIADRIMTLAQTALKVTMGEKVSFKRLSVIYDTFMYMITISNHKVYVSKRHHLPQEPVNV